jgi:hypothetical protein
MNINLSLYCVYTKADLRYLVILNPNKLKRKRQDL